MKKLLAVGVIVLFLGLAIAPSNGIIVFNDDTTPPVTNIYFDFPKPDGENGWYVTSVGVLLIATDDISGVNATYYRIDGGSWNIFVMEFEIEKDGYHVIDYYSVDNAGNIEDVNSSEIKIDQTPPKIEVKAKRVGISKWKIIADVSDDTSGVDRVEFYLDGELIFTDYDNPYEWIWKDSDRVGMVGMGVVRRLGDHSFDVIVYDKAGNSDGPLVPPSSHPTYARGIICNLEISEDSVTFFALITLCNVDSIHTFKQLSFPNNYEGYIGRYFIRATFYF